MASSVPLVRTDAVHGRLELPGVITESDGAAVGMLTITSQSEWPLIVHLEAPSDESVTFQLENENIRSGDPDDDPADWNQLFNEVDHIDRVNLEPHGEQVIVVSFRPRPLPRSSDASQSRPRGERAFGEAFGEATTFRERHAITLSKATVSLRIVPQPQVQPTATPVATAETSGSGVSSEAAIAAAAVYSTASSLATAVAAAAPPLLPPPPPPPIELALIARQCVSVLRTDVHELSFDAWIGTSAVRDFTVWNCSEAPLRFRLCARLLSPYFLLRGSLPSYARLLSPPRGAPSYSHASRQANSRMTQLSHDVTLA